MPKNLFYEEEEEEEEEVYITFEVEVEVSYNETWVVMAKNEDEMIERVKDGNYFSVLYSKLEGVNYEVVDYYGYDEEGNEY